MAKRFAKLEPNYLMTVSLPHSAWETAENVRELQRRLRSLLRFMIRNRYITAYGWVREVGANKPECVCLKPEEALARNLPDDPQQCVCGAGGRQVHRHFLLKVGKGGRNRYGLPWLPYATLQHAAERCGLGTLDFQPVFSANGAAIYVAKYLGKDLGRRIVDSRLRHARRWAMNRAASQLAPAEKTLGWTYDGRRVALVAVELLGATEVDWDATYWQAGDSP